MYNNAYISSERNYTDNRHDKNGKDRWLAYQVVVRSSRPVPLKIYFQSNNKSLSHEREHRKNK